MMKSSNQQVLRYDKYIMSSREVLLYGLQGMGLITLFGYFFYRSIIITVMGMPLIYVFLLRKKRELKEKKKQELHMQFKEAILSVNAALKAGYSLENAFRESERDMVSFYGTDSLIAMELKEISQGLLNGRTLTEMLRQLAKRSDIDDIRELTEVLTIGMQTGGNLREILSSYVSLIEEKVSVMEEIATIISARRYELKIMYIVPFFIIFYVELTSPGYFDPLYSDIGGRVIMTICLLFYLAALYFSEKIMQIRI